MQEVPHTIQPEKPWTEGWILLDRYGLDCLRGAAAYRESLLVQFVNLCVIAEIDIRTLSIITVNKSHDVSCSTVPQKKGHKRSTVVQARKEYRNTRRM